MSVGKAFRIVFYIGGKKKSILSARKQKDGTIIINPKIGDRPGVNETGCRPNIVHYVFIWRLRCVKRYY